MWCMLYWLIVMCCLSLLKADAGSEETLLVSDNHIYVKSRSPCPTSALPPNPVTGTKENGKPAQDSEHHALENGRRSHAPKKLLLVIPGHQDSWGGNGSTKLIQAALLCPAHNSVQVRKQHSLLGQLELLDVVNVWLIILFSLLPWSSCCVVCSSLLLVTCLINAPIQRQKHTSLSHSPDWTQQIWTCNSARKGFGEI